MKKGLFIICALAVVLGITSGALAGATAKQTSRFCVYVDHLDRGASYLDVSVEPKYGHKTCIVGKQGAKGAKGAKGATGAQGPKGDTGAKGATGPSGINSPLVYSFAAAIGPDTGACSDSGSGAGWATDTFDATFVVAMQPDGSYVLTKVVKGTFVTRAGVSQPNPSDCHHPPQSRWAALPGRSTERLPSLSRPTRGSTPSPRAERRARLTPP